MSNISIDVKCVTIIYMHEGRSPFTVDTADDKCSIIFSSIIKSKEILVDNLYSLISSCIKDLEQAPSFEEI